MTERIIFSGMQILLDQTWVKNQALVVEGEKIKAIIPHEMIKHHTPAKHYEFAADDYLVPGFIDLHVHGARGYDVMDADPDALKMISKALGEEGVTSFLATTMTAPVHHIETVLSLIAGWKNAKEGAAILGIHLEGPFIAKSKMGAQFGDACLLPNIDLLKRWQTLASNNIRIVTLAPELDGALPFIRVLKEMGIVASVGHTNATYAETNEAINAGCTQATHLFNAMRGMHQREPGAAGALLLSPRVVAELIVDGVHLNPGMVELAYRMKDKDQLLLVTDAMRAKCMGDGSYELGGQTVTAENNKVTLADGTLAGSVLRMNEAIRNMVKFTSTSLIDAIYMASLNPARVLQLDMKKGSIDHGKDADLVILNTNLDVQLTMRAGEEIFNRNSHH